jgi:hypothetical protein
LKERRLGASRDLFLCAADRKLNLQRAHLGDSNLNERLSCSLSHVTDSRSSYPSSDE